MNTIPNLRTVTQSLLLGLAMLPKLGFGQTEEPLKKWKAIQYDISLGTDNDHFYGMSLKRMMAMSQNPQDIQRDLKGMEEEISSSTAGLALYFNKSFAPYSQRLKGYRTDQELRLGFGCHAPKESMISYKNKGLDTSVVFCNMHSEITIEAAYLRKGTWGKNKKYNWYWGGGFNSSVTFSNEMLLIQGQYFEKGEHPSTQPRFEENTRHFAAKPLSYLRVYVPWGIHRILGKHWSVGIDAKRGIGVQTIWGGGSIFIPRTGTFAIGAKYLL